MEPLCEHEYAWDIDYAEHLDGLALMRRARSLICEGIPKVEESLVTLHALLRDITDSGPDDDYPPERIVELQHLIDRGVHVLGTAYLEVRLITARCDELRDMRDSGIELPTDIPDEEFPF